MDERVILVNRLYKYLHKKECDVNKLMTKFNVSESLLSKIKKQNYWILNEVQRFIALKRRSTEEYERYLDVNCIDEEIKAYLIGRAIRRPEHDYLVTLINPDMAEDVTRPNLHDMSMLFRINREGVAIDTTNFKDCVVICHDNDERVKSCSFVDYFEKKIQVSEGVSYATLWHLFNIDVDNKYLIFKSRIHYVVEDNMISDNNIPGADLKIPLIDGTKIYSVLGTLVVKRV